MPWEDVVNGGVVERDEEDVDTFLINQDCCDINGFDEQLPSWRMGLGT